MDDYIILKSETPEELQKLVNEKIKAGYQPVWPMSMWYRLIKEWPWNIEYNPTDNRKKTDYDVGYTFYQTLYKKEFKIHTNTDVLSWCEHTLICGWWD